MFVANKLIIIIIMTEQIEIASNCLFLVDLTIFFPKWSKLISKKRKINTLPKSKYLQIKMTQFFKKISGEAICHNSAQGESGWVCNQPFVANRQVINTNAGRLAKK